MAEAPTRVAPVSGDCDAASVIVDILVDQFGALPVLVTGAEDTRHASCADAADPAIAHKPHRIAEGWLDEWHARHAAPTQRSADARD